MERKAALEHKRQSAREVYDNITTPGWINNKAPRALKLRLDGNVMEISRNYTGEDLPNGKRRLGVKIIKDNLESSISKYEQELTAIEQNQPRSITTVDIKRRIIDLVPDEHFRIWVGSENVSPKAYSEQAHNFSAYVIAFSQGRIEPVLKLDLLISPPEKKGDLAKEQIRQLLTPLVLGEVSLEAFKYRWARRIRELLDFMGQDAIKNLGDVINNLPELERALVFSCSSINLMEDLGYLDLDECSARKYALYLRNIAFDPLLGDRINAYEFILHSGVERDNSGTLRLNEIVDLLCEPPYEGLIFEKMIESANAGSFTDLLIQFLISHPATSHLAIKLLQGLDENAPFPSSMLDNPYKRPRYKRS